MTRRFGESLVEGPYVSPSAYEHYILAMLQENAGRPDEAVDSLRRALGSDGTSGYLRTRLADVLLSTGRLDEAREELDAAQRLEPDRAETFVVRARLASRLGDQAGAEVALSHAIVLEPSQEDAYLALAAVQRARGHETQALATLRNLSAHMPSASAEEALGRAAIAGRDRKSAREHLRRAIELDGARNEARVELARLALGDGDTDIGLGLLAVAVERARDATLSLELARAAALAGRRAQALAILDRVEEDTQTLSARLDVASAYIDVGVPRRAALMAEAILGEEKRGDVRSAARVVVARAAEADGALGDAIAAWQELGPGDPDYTTAVLARARLLRSRGRDREAVALFEAAIADRTTRGRLDERDELAVALAEQRAAVGERDAALARLEALAALRPKAHALRLGIARLERDAGRWQEAVAILEPMVKLGDRAALLLLGMTLATAGQRLDDAARMLEHAESTAPDDAPLAHALGVVYLASGKLEAAERLLLRADHLARSDADVLGSLARLYQEKGDRDAAIAVLRRALATRPPERARQEIEAQLLMLERGRMGAR